MKLSKFMIYALNAGMLTTGFSAIAEEASNKTWPERSPIIFFGDRANEDWSYVDDIPSDEKSFSENLKRIDISENSDWKASVSGTNRFRFENRKNKNFVNGNDQDNEFVASAQFSGDIDYQDWLRFFGEVRTTYRNYDGIAPTDDAGTDIHQLFTEVSGLDLGGGELSVRLGRQEIAEHYWQMRAKEMLPVQGSWDAISANYHLNGYRVYGYFGEEVFPKINIDGTWPDLTVTHNGNWDDERNGNTSAGLYLETFTEYGLFKPFITTNHLESSAFVHTNGGEVDIETLGFSLYKMQPFGISYLFDAVYQMGTNDGKDVSAYMGHLNLSYAFQKDWHYRVGAIGHVASGSDADSDKVTTFDSLWTGDPLGTAVDAGYGNAIQAGAYLMVDYAPQQQVVLRALSTWRHNTDDAIYTAGRQKLFGEDSDEKYAYTQFLALFVNQITPNLKSELELSYAMDSQYINDVVGEDSQDISRVMWSLMYNF